MRRCSRLAHQVDRPLVSLGSRIALTIAGAVVALAAAITVMRVGLVRSSGEPIRVGVLHSLSGPMASSEVPVVNAIRMAADEINARGGLLGRRVELLVRDGKSDPETFAAEAERLITEDRVSVIFGCWTSASRRTVPPILVILRDSHDRIVYRWVITSPRRQLDPGESVTINEAVTDVPRSAKFAEIGWKPG